MTESAVPQGATTPTAAREARDTPPTDRDAALMRHALSLAGRGPVTGGNPQVGCVLVDSDGAIVAEGWHRGSGTAHAEVDALSRLPRLGTEASHAGEIETPSPETTRRDAAGLTAIVTLEPCNHTGRTGPCAVALIEAGVSRVVYAVSDPGALSSGGADRLRAAGVDVVAGVLAGEVGEFLQPWLTATRRGRPWVSVKWASSLDGRAAAADGTSQWITGTAARQRVHEQRAQSDAIVVGTGTVIADDPSLTARGDAGELMEPQPLPVVVGERDVPADAKLRRHPAGLVETHSRDLPGVLSALFERGIRRVYVEGGPVVASAFVEADLVDEFLVYLAPTLLGGARTALGDIGVASIAGQRRLRVTAVEQLGDDLLVTARPVGSRPALPIEGD
jgi:diaminohydroxyphosphoribosylaminopyrimidine deaminase/5-amino-6-(5-phosphoribosylamino)uracil reductase